MPHHTLFVEPECVLEHQGVKVYRCYQDDDFDHPETFYFTLNPRNTDSSSADSFDVRPLPEEEPPIPEIPDGMSTDEYLGTEDYFRARDSRKTWFKTTLPELILQTLREGIENGNIC